MLNQKKIKALAAFVFIVGAVVASALYIFRASPVIPFMGPKTAIPGIASMNFANKTCGELSDYIQKTQEIVRECETDNDCAAMQGTCCLLFYNKKFDVGPLTRVVEEYRNQCPVCLMLCNNPEATKTVCRKNRCDFGYEGAQ